jgi:rubrerythrin
MSLNEHDEGLTSLEALGIAIRAEMDAKRIYEELAARCTEPNAKRRFELLAADEERHYQMLKDKWNELAPDVELMLPPSRLPQEAETPEMREKLTMKQVLDMAILEERHSREFYMTAADETRDLSGQRMFRFLADMEHNHWMTLTQERDLLLRYPNYMQRGADPWKPEKSLGPDGEGR